MKFNAAAVQSDTDFINGQIIIFYQIWNLIDRFFNTLLSFESSSLISIDSCSVLLF